MKTTKNRPTRRDGRVDTRYAVPALDKGLDVIEFLARENDGLTLNEMLAIHGSGGWRVRTRDEFRLLIEMGGFILNRIIPTRSSVSVLECVGA